MSTTLVLGILLLILFTTPRGDDSEEVDFTVSSYPFFLSFAAHFKSNSFLCFSPFGAAMWSQGYDNNFISRVTVMVLMCVGAFLGSVCVLLHFVIPKRQARALNYQRDVLSRY